ncbi:MAG: hypothetical protein JJV88_03150 [Sulfurovum sp.]|nr:hypothetical protein [Sulfurovaceae bacterium]
MYNLNRLIILLIILFTFNGCEKKPITVELRDVHWDRDMCQRCKMVTSDRHHSVQVINPKNGKSYMFDDIGCTLLWFEEEQISWKDRAKVWITDGITAEWIDGRDAYYNGDNITPMAFGFTAHKDIKNIKYGEKVIKYNQLLEKIKEIEKRNNSRGR